MDSTIGEIYKIGNIYKRSKILKRWNKRSIVLNYVKGTLNLRKGKSAKEKVILLEDYEVVWVGQPKKTKVFYFSLKVVKNINAHKYKRLHIGDIEEANARHWMQEIERIVDKKYTPPRLQGPGSIAITNNQGGVTFDKNGATQQDPLKQTIVKFSDKNDYLEVPSSTQKAKPILVNNNNNMINNNNEVRLSSRQIVSVQKGEDYDEILKQFESCCQYEEDQSNEYDERMPYERAVTIPDFNYMFNISFMPDTIVDNPGIDDIAMEAPATIREEVNALLEAYYKKPSRFVEHVVNKKKLKEIGNQIYENVDDSTHLIHLTIANMTPIEVYEEIQTPSTNEHWNTIIENYSLSPPDHLPQTRNLSQLTFNFKYDRGEGRIVPKEIFAYRYSVQFTNAYFIWEFQDLGIDKVSDVDQSKLIQNKMRNNFLIFPDQQEGCHLIIKSKMSFNQEAPDQQIVNLHKFLTSFNLVQKCASTNSQDPEIIIECNADQADVEDQDDIDSGVFISVRIDRTLACGNAEDSISSTEVDSLLVKVTKNEHIEDCIKAKHEKRIVKGKYEVVRSTKEAGHYSFKLDYKRDEKKGGMQYLNEKLMKEQKTVVMSIVKRIGSNLLNGRSIMNISMPVQVFDSKTILQRLARGFGHAPNFLEKAAQTTSVVEQIKLSAAFLLSSFIMGVGQEKPFNPVIGETMQGRLNGCPIYFEQTSHHPAISNYQLYGRGYDLYGCHIPLVSMSANSLAGQVQGGPNIHIKHSGTKIQCIWGTFQLYNIIFGQRMLNMTGRAYVFEAKNNLVLELIYNPNNTKGIGSLFSKRYAIDEVQGAMYRVHPHVIQQLTDAFKHMANKSDLSIDPNKDVIQMISKAEGIWSKYLDFDGIRYWDDDKDFPFMLEYEATPLPSDSKFRPDLLYFQKNQKNESQNQKEAMEVAQRHDQKLRELNKKNKGKK